MVETGPPSGLGSLFNRDATGRPVLKRSGRTDCPRQYARMGVMGAATPSASETESCRVVVCVKFCKKAWLVMGAGRRGAPV
jgi:hypothetical protein